MPNRPHTLYRFYNPAGVLLYVGITGVPWARWKTHAGEKSWWANVATATIEHYPDRDSVMAAERAAIIAEKPQHNIVHNRGNRPNADDPVTEDLRAIFGAPPADGPWGSAASDMPDDCERCHHDRIYAIYYPLKWREGEAHYICQHGHYWTCWWGHNLSGDAREHGGRAVKVASL